MVRMSADERRESAITAALSEFAHGGYSGTTTESIARRVGVSQPYLFRLFPNKQAIFLAAAERCLDQTRQVFEDATAGLPPEEKLTAMARAYQKMLHEDREPLLMQMQVYAAVAAAEASGDHEFGTAVRKGWEELWDTVLLELGGDDGEATEFLAYGMLINTLVSLGFPAGHRLWQGIYEGARPK